MKHLVLLGDSIFDNGVYVAGGPDVISQVREKIPADWHATLCAVDGDRIADVATQLKEVPSDATHFAISVGGNDALDQFHLLHQKARSFAEVLEHLGRVGEAFRAAYNRMLGEVLERGLPTVVCTIYEGNLPNAHEQKIAATALKIFNDAIVREAIAAGVPLLDLRAVCSQPEDYANPIEPSSVGGEKIAAGLVSISTAHDFSIRQFYKE